MCNVEKLFVSRFHPQQFRAFIRVMEGGGTGNEAAAVRLGEYLKRNLGMEVRYLVFAPSEDMIMARCNITFEFDLAFPSAVNIKAKLLRLGVAEPAIIKTDIELYTDKPFLIFGAADTEGSTSADEAKAMPRVLAKIANSKGRDYDPRLYKGFINLTPYAWKSDSRSVYDNQGNRLAFPAPLPVRAIYPQATAVHNPLMLAHQPGLGGQQSPHTLVTLTGTLKATWDISLTYGLHALYEEGDYRWLTRASSALFTGLFNYMSATSHKNTLLLALHPKNDRDVADFPSAPDKVVYSNSDIQVAASSTSKIHFIYSNHPQLSQLIANIGDLAQPQLVVVRKHPDDNIGPGSFYTLLDNANLPVMSEGANTVGQLLQLQKPFLTIGDPNQQLPNLNASVARFQEWQNLLARVFELPTASEETLRQLEELRSEEGQHRLESLTENARHLLLSIREPIMSEPDSATVGQIADLITAAIPSSATQDYINQLVDIERLFVPEVQNQVLLALVFLFTSEGF